MFKLKLGKYMCITDHHDMTLAVNTFPNTPFLDRPKVKEAADDNKGKKKVKLLILSNFTFFHNVFLKIFSLQCVKMSIYGGKG